MKAPKVRQRHIPQRTCVGCGEVEPKRGMVRVVRTPEGSIEVDPTGKRSGRGAYLHKEAVCWTKAVQKSALSRALKVDISAEDKARLLEQGRLYDTASASQSGPEAGREAGA